MKRVEEPAALIGERTSSTPFEFQPCHRATPAELSRPKRRLPGMKFRHEELTSTWYLRFFQLLYEDVVKSQIEQLFDNVSFIVFNYDRCVEFFLVNAPDLFDYYAKSLTGGG